MGLINVRVFPFQNYLARQFVPLRRSALAELPDTRRVPISQSKRKEHG